MDVVWDVEQGEAGSGRLVSCPARFSLYWPYRLSLLFVLTLYWSSRLSSFFIYLETMWKMSLLIDSVKWALNVVSSTFGHEGDVEHEDGHVGGWSWRGWPWWMKEEEGVQQILLNLNNGTKMSSSSRGHRLITLAHPPSATGASQFSWCFWCFAVVSSTFGCFEEVSSTL